MVVWSHYFQLSLILGEKAVWWKHYKFWMTAQSRHIFVSIPRGPFGYIYYLRVHIQVKNLAVFGYLSFVLLCNWRIPSKSSGTICSHTSLWSVSRSSRVAALQSAPDAVKLVWITQECSPRKTEIVRQQQASIPVLNYHHTTWFWTSDLYCSNTQRQDSHTGEGPERTKVLQGDILPRCWGAVRPFFYLLRCVQMHTNTKSYVALSAAFFPGEVITLWVDCMGSCSGRPFLTTGLTNHSSFRQWVSVSLHRDSKPTLLEKYNSSLDRLCWLYWAWTCPLILLSN